MTAFARLSGALLFVLSLAACEDLALVTQRADASSDVVHPTTWPCPAGWVQGALGGCGPSEWLCEADGGAADGACSAQRADATVFRGGEDGAVEGAWAAPGLGGPPLEWSPDAGIHACPSGWSLRPDQTCDPALPTRCAEDSEPLPGGTCTGDAPCGAAPWPDPGALLPGTRVARVRAGEDDETADGSARAPYGSIARAAAAAGDGGVVIVTDGVYPSALRVTAPLTIVGRCASRVVLQGASDAPAVLVASGEGATLSVRGVTLRGGLVGLSVEGPARGELRAVTLDASLRSAVVAAGLGAVATLVDVTSRPSPTLTPSIGVVARGGARISASRSSLRGAGEIGVAAVGAGTRVTVEDSLVRSGVRAEGHNPMALFASDGASLEVSRVLVEHGDGQAVATPPTPGARAAVTLRDLVVRDLDAIDGAGVTAVMNLSSSDVDAARVLIEDCRGFDAWVRADSSASVTLSDAVLRAPSPTSSAAPAAGLATGAFGASNRIIVRGVRIENARLAGVELNARGALDLTACEVTREAGGEAFRALSMVQPYARAEVRWLRAAGLHGAAVAVQAEGARAVIEDSLIRWADDDLPARVDDLHATVIATDGAALDLTRTRISNAPALGLTVDGVGTSALLNGSTIERVRAVTGANLGVGVLASREARCELVASRVDDARAGIIGTDLARVRIDGARVRGAAGTASSGGVGVLLRTGARGVMSRVLIERVEAFGVALLDDDTSLDAEDLAIRDARGTEPASGASSEGAILGVGLAVTQGARATLRRVFVSDVRGAAIMAAITTSPDGGVTGSGAARLDLEDLYARRVTSASLGSATARASGLMAVGVLSGEAGEAAVRRALIVDGADGVLTLSERTSLRDVVAVYPRGCALRTGVNVSSSAALSRAVSVVGEERGPCLNSVLGDVSVSLIGL